MSKPIYRLVWTLALAFIALTSLRLPPVVASHFGAGGAANGYMPRTMYLAVLLGIMLAVPLLLVHAIASACRSRPDLINLPERDYWLAPQRIDETIARLEHAMRGFAAGLLVFLCAVHALVVQANSLPVQRLPSAWFAGALAAFVLFVLVWIASLSRAFRAPR
jgi:uncharacterized membrane protein